MAAAPVPPFEARHESLRAEIRVRARRVTSERLLDQIEDAYAAKYNTKASQKYVRGFRTPRRRATTTEFIPR